MWKVGRKEGRITRKKGRKEGSDLLLLRFCPYIPLSAGVPRLRMSLRRNRKKFYARKKLGKDRKKKQRRKERMIQRQEGRNDAKEEMKE